MNKTTIQVGAVSLTSLLLMFAALGYLVVPSSMLSVVGIEGTPTSEFLVRTLAAAFLAMLPSAWSVRRRGVSSSEQAVLAGLSLYMLASSAVDLHAYYGELVGIAAVPSIVLRSVLGAILGWLTLRD